MAPTTETRPTTKEVTVYRCDRCNEPVGESGLTNGVHVVTSLMAQEGRPVTPPHGKGWHWDICWPCFTGFVVAQFGGKQP